VELFIFARFYAREGQEMALVEALRAEVDDSRRELGCLAHDAYRSTHDSHLFYIHSRWSNEAAFERHAKLPHTLRFVEAVQPLIDHELDVTRARSIVKSSSV
jgi:quinol monooxygenase YgiN